MGKGESMTKSKLLELITDLGWDYQSMTTSGRDTYDQIMRGLGVLKENEKWMEL